MTPTDAEAVVSAVLAPETTEGFFAAVGASRFFADTSSACAERARLLGDDPEATLLNAYATHAPILDCHAVSPAGPPPGPATVADAASFRALIRTYHDRNYTVRVPEVRALAPALLRFTRALEALICQPVEVSAFWSRAGARAKIHYDNNDNLIVQLVGQKRWFVSTDPPGLQNAWLQIGEPLPQLDRHAVVDLVPGDLLYVPRGTPHSVESTTDSLHVAILFTPMTMRAAVIAALDHLSDLSRPYRATAAVALNGPKAAHTAGVPGLVAALEALAAQCRQPGFVAAALAKASSRGMGALQRLVPRAGTRPLTPATRVRHAELSAAYLRDAGAVVDLAVPGGHIPINAAAAPALAFIAATPAFAIGELPGLPPEVAVALVERLIAAGWLEPDA